MKLNFRIQKCDLDRNQKNSHIRKNINCVVKYS